VAVVWLVALLLSLRVDWISGLSSQQIPLPIVDACPPLNGYLCSLPRDLFPSSRLPPPLPCRLQSPSCILGGLFSPRFKDA